MIKLLFERSREYIVSFTRKVKADPLFYLLLTAVIVIAVFFRTYDYFNRIYIHSDHSLYAQLAKYAVDNVKIPQIGVFPQAPFFTGPEWIWILGLFYLVPLGVLAPWYMMTLASFIFIFLIWWIGREIGGKWMGLLEAVLAAIGVLGWTSLAESRIKSLAKSRKEKQDRDSTA